MLSAAIVCAKLRASVCVVLPILAVSTCLRAQTPKSFDGRTFVVTDGAISSKNGVLSTDSAEMRAVLSSGSARSVVTTFTYLGPTASVSRLADGEVRNQFGLKFRAQDVCNLVYVMWRFSEHSLVVSVKRNPGLSTSVQCGDRGYINIGSPVPMPSVATGSTHTLQATLEGRELLVVADGRVVWQASIPDTAMTFDGPVGVRSDNAHLDFTFTAID